MMNRNEVNIEINLLLKNKNYLKAFELYTEYKSKFNIHIRDINFSDIITKRLTESIQFENITFTNCIFSLRDTTEILGPSYYIPRYYIDTVDSHLKRDIILPKTVGMKRYRIRFDHLDLIKFDNIIFNNCVLDTNDLTCFKFHNCIINDSEIYNISVIACEIKNCIFNNTIFHSLNLFGCNLNNNKSPHYDTTVKFNKIHNNIFRNMDMGDYGNICPQDCDLIGYKVLQYGKIAKLLIPKEARRTSILNSNMNKAEFAKVLSIYYKENPTDLHDEGNTTIHYKVGEIVRPTGKYCPVYYETWNGIYFYLTEEDTSTRYNL